MEEERCLQKMLPARRDSKDIFVSYLNKERDDNNQLAELVQPKNHQNFRFSHHMTQKMKLNMLCERQRNTGGQRQWIYGNAWAKKSSCA